MISSDTREGMNATTATRSYKEMSLSYNRHKDHVALEKARARVKAENNKWDQSTPTDVSKLEKRARHLKDTPTPCSCEMCRNPRRSRWANGTSKLTMQERKALNKINETEL